MTHLARIRARIARGLDTYFTASDVVWSLVDRRRPEPDDLRKLGLDPKSYLSLGHG